MSWSPPVPESIDAAIRYVSDGAYLKWNQVYDRWEVVQDVWSRRYGERLPKTVHIVIGPNGTFRQPDLRDVWSIWLRSFREQWASIQDYMRHLEDMDRKLELAREKAYDEELQGMAEEWGAVLQGALKSIHRDGLGGDIDWSK